MLWQDMTTEQIIGGVTPDGVRYLKLFLQDYSQTFKVDNLCGSCNNLIADYHKKYTIRMREKDNTCQYRLLEKYNGIALEPCSNVRVNNGNITDELGAILMANKGARIFAKFPTQDKEHVKVNLEIDTTQKTIVEPTAQADKPKRKRRTKKQ